MRTILAITLAFAAGTASAQSPADLCLAQIKRTLKDPESARIEATSKWSPVETPDGKGGTIMAAHHTLMVNAKNSFGGYVGGQVYTCLLTPDEKRVISVRKF